MLGLKCVLLRIQFGVLGSQTFHSIWRLIVDLGKLSGKCFDGRIQMRGDIIKLRLVLDHCKAVYTIDCIKGDELSDLISQMTESRRSGFITSILPWQSLG